MITDEQLLNFWGKSGEAGVFHPLVYHSMDAGYVATVLTECFLSRRSMDLLSRALGLTDAEAAVILIWLTAAHDIGKASAFQAKDQRLAQNLVNGGYTLPLVAPKPHGFCSTRALIDTDALARFTRDTRSLLAKIVGGHHGSFPGDQDTTGVLASLGGDAWETAREAILKSLRTQFGGSEWPVDIRIDEKLSAVLLPLIGGFVTMADWVASMVEYFPLTAPGAKGDYAALSRAAAISAIDSLGIVPSIEYSTSFNFSEIFGFTPNALQRRVSAYAAGTDSAFLMIVEAPMGCGKTEAALAMAHLQFARRNAAGLFVGLPTQATGNALFDRIRKGYLARAGHHGKLNLQLVHGSAVLSSEFNKLLSAAQSLRESQVSVAVAAGNANLETKEDETDGHIVAEAWFTGRKRALLAPLGVGTIDQALLGVVRARHWFLRLFGLAGKVVILDEVHAYDLYTSRLLERLLEWLKALGCTVIVLSATLSPKQRSNLVMTWTGGTVATERPEAAIYPRVTTVIGIDEPVSEHVAVSAAFTIPVRISRVEDSWVPVAEELSSTLHVGGRAIIFCNTVDRVQSARKALKELEQKDGWEIEVLHARTLRKWRRDTETWALSEFGKASPSNRVDGSHHLLIASPAGEQSLDLDSDWMLTEIAPVDLLLQRMGRLWRHPNRIRATEAPIFRILYGLGYDGLPIFPEHTETVYSRFILLMTAYTLNGKEDIRLPGDIDDLVAAVYDRNDYDQYPERWATALSAAYAEHQQEADDMLGKANAISIPSPTKGAVEILRLLASKIQYLDDEDPTVHETVRAATRLGRSSITIVCIGTDADGKPLAASPTGEPGVEQTRQMLDNSVQVSRQRVVNALIDMPTLAAWPRNPHLRFCRAVNFVNGVSADIPGVRLELSRRLGLRYMPPNE